MAKEHRELEKVDDEGDAEGQEDNKDFEDNGPAVAP